MRRTALLFSCVLGGTLLFVPISRAADGEAATRALAKAQALLKQVNAQRVASETELANVKLQLAEKDRQLSKMTGDLKAQKSSLDESATSLRAAEQKGTSLSGDLERTSAKLEKSRDRLAKLGAKYKETVATLQATETARQTLDAALVATRAELADSEAKNLVLYQANREMLEKFQHEGVFSRIVRSEPLTGISQVKAETLVQEYEQKLQDSLREANRPAVEGSK
jgi:chromosome segregation ATPase